MARTIPRTAAAALLAASLSLGCVGAGAADGAPAPAAAEPPGGGSADEDPDAGPPADDGSGEAEDGAQDGAEDGAAGGSEAVSGADAAPPDAATLREEADRILDDWHRAASEVDEERYLGHMAPDAVFMGTDRTERWDLATFREYVEECFGQGRGWTYEPSDRYVHLGPDRDVAWFDERLTSNSYGDLRGTGALRWTGETWQIVHYSMTFTVPNEVARDVVGIIRRSGR